MLDELGSIDTSAIDELRDIKREQEVLDSRLEQMEEKKETVSQVVYDRVRADYESQLAALEERATPLEEQARKEYAKLSTLHDKVTAALETARLNREELEFRHELGELEDNQLEERLEEADECMKERDVELGEAEKLKSRFIEVFDSEKELESQLEEKFRETGGPGKVREEASAEAPLTESTG